MKLDGEDGWIRVTFVGWRKIFIRISKESTLRWMENRWSVRKADQTQNNDDDNDAKNVYEAQLGVHGPTLSSLHPVRCTDH